MAQDEMGRDEMGNTSYTPDSTVAADRRAVRKRLRAARRALAPRQRSRDSRSIARIAGRSVLLRRFKRAGIFLSADGEVDTSHLIARMWRRRMQVWLPCLGQPPRAWRTRMWFRRYTPGLKLKRGAFGIREPISGPAIAARQLDLIFMPLVGFDHHGNRLGMGGGYYDRSLAHLRARKVWRRPMLVGLAFDLQRVDHLDAQFWDVPLDAVLTQSGLHVF